MARLSRVLPLGLVAAAIALPSTATALEPAPAPLQRPSTLPPSAEPEPAPPPQPDEDAPGAPAEGSEPGVAPPTAAESGDAVAPSPTPDDTADASPPAAAEPGTVTDPSTATDPSADGTELAEPGDPALTDQISVESDAEPDAPPPPSPSLEQPPESSPPPDLGKRPYPGTGQITGGGIMIGLGSLTMVSGVIVLAASADYPPLRTGGTVLLVSGMGMIGGGAGLVHVGSRNRKKYKAWHDHSGLGLPPSGNGMIVGGSVLGGLGLLTLVGSGRPLLIALELVSGGVLLGVGIHRHLKFKRTLEGHGLALVPTYDRRRRTAGLAVSGRF